MSIIFQIAVYFLDFILLMMFVAFIMSWIDPTRRFGITRFAFDVVDPIVDPIRKIIPPIGFFDVSFIIAFILLRVVIGFLESTGGGVRSII